MIIHAAPGTPNMIVVTTITFNSFSLSWNPPSESNGVITVYSIQCCNEEHKITHTINGSQQTTTTLSGLLP